MVFMRLMRYACGAVPMNATNPCRNCCNCADFFAGPRPDPSNTAPARDTSRRVPDQVRVPSVRNTGSYAFCTRIVPKPAGDAPMTAAGRSRKTL